MNQLFNTASQITAWLHQYKVTNYILVPDEKHGFIIDVIGNVDLQRKKLEFIPIKFNKVSGYFWCNDNTLDTLDFAPVSVGGTFSCGHNRLTSLRGSPQSVGEDFICWSNQLTTLSGCASHVPGDFYCNHNLLSNLRDGPTTVGKHFCCNDNQISTLDFLPQAVGGIFMCVGNLALKEYQKEWKFDELKMIVDIEKENSILSNSINAQATLSTTTLKNHKI